MKHFGKVIILSILCLEVSAGTLYPSVYYSPKIDKKQMSCEEQQLRSVRDMEGDVLETICHKEYKECQFFGSCIIVDGNTKNILNFVTYSPETEETFFAKIDGSKCDFGLGLKDICLDPFYSIAADLTKHKLGDVLFISALKGVVLPNGEIHDGFVIVRDSSSLLPGSGAGNISFFTGHYKYDDKNNPFVKIGFNNMDNTKTYRKANKAETKLTLKNRNYPSLKKAN